MERLVTHSLAFGSLGFQEVYAALYHALHSETCPGWAFVLKAQLAATQNAQNKAGQAAWDCLAWWGQASLPGEFGREQRYLAKGIQGISKRMWTMKCGVGDGHPDKIG